LSYAVILQINDIIGDYAPVGNYHVFVGIHLFHLLPKGL
jgi:hypothetical protein